MSTLVTLALAATLVTFTHMRSSFVEVGLITEPALRQVEDSPPAPDETINST